MSQTNDCHVIHKSVVYKEQLRAFRRTEWHSIFQDTTVRAFKTKPRMAFPAFCLVCYSGYTAKVLLGDKNVRQVPLLNCYRPLSLFKLLETSARMCMLTVGKFQIFPASKSCQQCPNAIDVLQDQDLMSLVGHIFQQSLVNLLLTLPRVLSLP